MAQADKPTILAALNTITDPVSGAGLSDAGLVRGLVLSPDRVGFMLEVPQAQVNLYGPVRAQAERLLSGLDGIKKAQVVLTAEAEAPVSQRPAPQAKLSPQAVDQTRPKAPVASSRPAHVKRVIVVGSGKGGVGKSTVALSLALGLRGIGLKVGLLDADIYGPSMPLMLGITTPPAFGPEKMMIPPEAFGLKVNSVGFLVDPDQAMIWRGPMASQALTQLLTQTLWGTEIEPLDVLVVDMPPGTGDVQLTLTQKTIIDGAVVVSTPQEMALVDARRAITLFEKTGVKILGIVENMAWFENPVTGEAIFIFGHDGAQLMARNLDVPFLGDVPLDQAVRKGSDEARPVVALEPDGDIACRFRLMAEMLRATLEL